MGLFRRQPRTLVASAAPFRGNNDEKGMGEEMWQRRALLYYNTCGEVRFCSQFYARMVARVRFFPARIKEDGTLDAIEEGPAVEALNRIQGPGGGRSRIQFDYGRLMFVTGEGALFVNDTDDPAKERWRFLWRGELKKDEPDGPTWRKNGKNEPVEKGTAYRMWTPHPERSDWADSPLRPVLDIAEELNILTATVRSTAVSRMLKGMILLPSELSPAPMEPGKDEDPEQSVFLAAMVQHFKAQIEDPAAAEAQAPFLLEGAYEYLDRVKWIELHNTTTDYLERDLRIEAIKRLALGLDMPPEALEGFSNTNHWAAQQIQWDMWRSHGVPIADQFAADLSEIYLRPTLAEAGESDIDAITIGYDDSQVVISPDQTAVADQAMDRMAISFSGYRKMKGIPEAYAPDEDEQQLVAGVKMRDPVVAGFEEAAPPQAGPTPNPDEAAGSNVPARPANGRVVSRQESMTAAIVGAAHMALAQCRSKAGARLASQVRKPPGHGDPPCPDCLAMIEDKPLTIVASALGAEMIENLAKRDPIALVAGGTADFKGMLEEWGVLPADVAVLCERIESYAAKTLFDPVVPNLPPGYAAHVEHALEVAQRALQAA